MQLNLQAHWQSIPEQPFRQRSQEGTPIVVPLRREHRAEQHGTRLRESVSFHHVDGPLIIPSTCDDEFRLIFLAEMAQIVPMHTVIHLTAGTFDVQNDACPGINRSYVDGPTRFDEHVKTVLTQERNQLERRGLSQRLSARDFNQGTPVPLNLAHYGIETHVGASVKRIGRITPGTSEGTPR